MAECQGYTKSGLPCKANAGADGWCWTHRPDPEAAEARRLARSAGGKAGKARTLNPGAVRVRFSSARDITGLLASICGWVLTGQIDSKTANAGVYAASAALRSLDAGEIERQIRELREEIEKLKGVRLAG